MSWKAKGLMTYLLSLPEDWKIYVDEIVKHSTDGEAGLRSALKELIKYGYIKFERKRNEKGIFVQGIYTIIECPRLENPNVDEPDVENQALLNTNKQNTNNTKSGQTCSDEHLCVPSLQEVSEYYHEKQLDVPPDRFWEYNTKRGWIDDKGHKIHNWKKAYESMLPYPDEVYDPSLDVVWDNDFTSEFTRFNKFM